MKEFWEKVSKIDYKSIKIFIEEMLEVLGSPQVEPQKTALVIAVLIIFGLLVVAIGFLVFSFFEPARRKKVVEVVEVEEKEEVESYEEEKRKKWISRESKITLIIAAAFTILLLVVGIAYTGRPSFCNTCHRMNKEYESWQRSTHRTVGCLKCHQEPGISGLIVQKFDYIRWALLAFTNHYNPKARAVVSNSSCNRCHREVARETVVRYGIKVRHRDFLIRGDKCTDCHNTVAHGEVVPVKRLPSMDHCILCHNQKVASAECKVCHTRDLAQGPRVTRAEMAKVALGAPKTCRGCHSIDKCTACHGLEMPHPEGWTAGGHARLAFTNRSLCWRCHPGGSRFSDYFAFCNSCHQFPPLHETAEDDWIELHGPVALKTKTWGYSNCWLCHGVGVCDNCHVGKKEVLRGLPAHAIQQRKD